MIRSRRVEIRAEVQPEEVLSTLQVWRDNAVEVRAAHRLPTTLPECLKKLGDKSALRRFAMVIYYVEGAIQAIELGRTTEAAWFILSAAEMRATILGEFLENARAGSDSTDADRGRRVAEGALRGGRSRAVPECVLEKWRARANELRLEVAEISDSSIAGILDLEFTDWSEHTIRKHIRR